VRVGLRGVQGGAGDDLGWGRPHQPRPFLSCRLSDSGFDSLRLWVLVALCLLRLAVTRPHLQAYLCLAKSRVEQLRREAGRIEAREIQQRVWSPRGRGGAGTPGWGGSP
jgi:hypothetical protein